MDCHKKIVIIGDGFIGKSCMAEAFRNKKFVEVGNVTVVDQFSLEVQRNGHTYFVKILDIVGQQDYEAVYSYLINDADVIIMCYAVNDTSYHNVCSTWMRTLHKMNYTSKLVLVATKLDTREQTNPSHITTDMGRKLKRKINAVYFVECSSKLMVNIDMVFERAVDSMFVEPRSSFCKLL